MKQDAGKKVQIKSTYEEAETTGQMLITVQGVWAIEVKYKNGVKEWFFDYELNNISNSK